METPLILDCMDIATFTPHFTVVHILLTEQVVKHTTVVACGK